MSRSRRCGPAAVGDDAGVGKASFSRQIPLTIAADRPPVMLIAPPVADGASDPTLVLVDGVHDVPGRLPVWVSEPNPHKVIVADAIAVLTPRASFEAWSETVEGQSHTWSLGQVEADMARVEINFLSDKTSQPYRPCQTFALLSASPRARPVQRPARSRMRLRSASSTLTGCFPA